MLKTIKLACLTLMLMLGLTTPATAEIQQAAAAPAYIQVCNSPNSESQQSLRMYMPLEYVQKSSIAGESGAKIGDGECGTMYNADGSARILFKDRDKSGFSYKWGQDGKGWGPCVNVTHDNWLANPPNDPVGGIDRLKAFAASNCLNVVVDPQE